MKMKKCIVVGAGTHYAHKPSPTADDFVIAVDGGYEYLKKIDIHTDIVIGDFDSLQARPDHPNVLELPKEKDDTDMFYALKFGIGKGYKTFHIYGGTGGRIDHTLANIQCIAYLAERGLQGFLFAEDSVMTCIKNSQMNFDKSYKGTISVFSHTNISKGVCLRGLKYTLQDYELNNACPLGVSNEFIGKNSSVSVKDGVVVIIFPLTPN